MPFYRALPLYRDLGFPNRDEAQRFDATTANPHAPTVEPHPGLIFDKYIDTWSIASDGVCKDQKPVTQGNQTPKARAGSKRVFFDEVASRPMAHVVNGLNAVVVRQKALVSALDGECFQAETGWRLVSGLGSGHPFEAGLIWHRTLGVPYLPGSSIKGMIRAWAKPAGEGGWEAVSASEWNDCVKLFGNTDEVGKLIIFDAIPTAPPQLEVDIMNPHYGEYYADPATTPPADYLSPKPVFFVAVKPCQEFLFSIAPRPGANATLQDIEEGERLLKEALSNIGAGGKTAVGYGWFNIDGQRGHAMATAGSTGSVQSGRERWSGAKLAWSKGTQELTASKDNQRSAPLKLSDQKQRQVFLGAALSEEDQVRLTTGKSVSATVEIEILGNHTKIVGLLRES